MSVTRTYKRTMVKGALVPTITRVPSTEPIEETYRTIYLPAIPGNMGNIPQKGPGVIFLTLDDLTSDQLEDLNTENLDLLGIDDEPSSPSLAPISYSIKTNFTIGQAGASTPFDTMGAVGPDEVVVTINGRYYRYDKAGNQLFSSNLSFLFPDYDHSPFDPRVVYDPYSERFFACVVDGRDDTDNSFLHIAVSKSSAPADGWDAFMYQTDLGGNVWLDFPMLGYNADVVVVNGYLFLKDGGVGGTHAPSYIFPKSDLLLPTPTIANMEFVQDIPGAKVRTHPHVDTGNGSLPHSGWRWSHGFRITRVDTIFNGSYSAVEVAEVDYPYLGGLPGQQPDGPAGPVDSLEHFIGTQIGTYPVRVGNFVYMSIGARVGDDSSIAVVKINYTTNVVEEREVLHVDGVDLIYPSIAVNNFGDIVIGCTASGTSLYASSMVFVGLDDDDGITFADPVIVQEGDWPYRSGGSRNRWGDYSATVIDPKNQKRFWTFQTYAKRYNPTTDALYGRSIKVTEILVDYPNYGSV